MTKRKGLAKKIMFGILGIIILFVLVVFLNFIISAHYASKVTKGQPIDNYGAHKSALLVVDIQEATTGSLSMYPFYQKNADILIEEINHIADIFNMQNVLTIYIRSEISNPLINLLNSSYAKGSQGAQFDKRMKTFFGPEVVKKAKDSFKDTCLDSILISNRINQLFIVGLDAAECVNATVEAAQNRNYEVYLIEEAILSKSTEMLDSMITSFIDRGIRIFNIDSLEILIKAQHFDQE
jgi:nicotinamidase/pyrazinamidase